MYRKNSQITTGSFSVMKKKIKKLFSDVPFSTSYPKNDSLLNGSSTFYAAITILVTFFFTASCDSTGTVGNDIITEDDAVQTETYFLDDFSILNENTFSGRLPTTSLGYVDDPEFGTIRSVALLKPAIAGSQVDTLLEDDSISLRLIFNETEYGFPEETSRFEVYEAAEIWRGTELRYNDPVELNLASKIGEFEMTDQDTVVVPLSDVWTAKFAEFFNNDSDNSDSLYVRNFPGVAVVPVDGNQNIRFLKNNFTDPDSNTEQITSFVLDPREEDEDDDEEEEEDEEENDIQDRLITVRDWGASFMRDSEPQCDDTFTIHNTETVLKLQISLPEEELSDKNILDAKLILTKSAPSQTPPGFVRPVTDLIRANEFEEQPVDIMAEIFSTDPNFFVALEDDESQVFKLDITQHIIDGVYGEEQDRSLYLTTETIVGTLYSARFFNSTTADSTKPRLVITYVQ